MGCHPSPCSPVLLGVVDYGADFQFPINLRPPKFLQLHLLGKAMTVSLRAVNLCFAGQGGCGHGQGRLTRARCELGKCAYSDWVVDEGAQGHEEPEPSLPPLREPQWGLP